MHPALARDAVRALAASRIREVANAAMGSPDVLAFWFGEPDRPTPRFIVDAAKAALDDGDTFYLPNLGMPALREALAGYVGRLHGGGAPIGAGRIGVTSSGVSALMLAAQALLSPGDRVVAVVPLWPNLTAIAAVLGARVDTVALAVDGGRWRLDVERLLAALTPDTRLLMINSPGNPTGWVMPPDAIRAVRAHCRRHGIWILSDEAYERLVFDGTGCAPSFLDGADPADRLVVANTFSKTWQMTGWRLGWLVMPETLAPDVEKLVEFNTSCAPGFVQRAGLAAVRDGEAATAAFASYVQAGARALVAALAGVPRVEPVTPDGAMYVLLRVDGERDSLALAKALVRDARLGLAPGVAFGDACEGWLRWCVARPAATLQDGAERLGRFLARR
ncbi:MAG TPA: pyridoxal phosphate-dependent aminotransferase [Burkholderiaceae bacterium]|nr:pyridoxal phosphate-dependent aminotransferase [Burkholderiaceae bacterium]